MGQPQMQVINVAGPVTCTLQVVVGTGVGHEGN
jgi:hypothetical protein